MQVLLICPPAVTNLPRINQPYSFLQFFQSNLLKSYARASVVGEHLGLESLTASLEQAGHTVTLLDACLMQYQSWQQVVAELLKGEKDRYGLVGFTGSQDVFLENIEIARALRQAGWQAHLVFGQDFCSLNHRQLMDAFPEIDSIGRGEGDHLVVELANALEQAISLEQVTGLTYRDTDGIHVNPARNLIPNLDRLPFPDRRNQNYVQQAGLATGMVSSRGCGYNRCTFCYPNVFTSANKSLPGGPWRARSPENVVDELELLVRQYHAEQVTFVDENFLGCGEAGIQRGYQIAEEILRRKVKVRYMINCRSVDIQPSLFSLLKASGLQSVFVGFESGSQKILDYYQKGATVEQQERALAIICELALDLVVGYIFFDPVSTVEDLRTSLDFYLRLDQYDASKFSQRLRVLPGTILYKRMSASKTVFGDIWRTRYAYASPQIDTVYALVSGLFYAVLPELLRLTLDGKVITEKQADQVIRLMEKDAYCALDLAQAGLASDSPVIQETIQVWKTEIGSLITVNGH
jgi:radical SAM superfamily enzyme YgiQ (UPF0313 family)